jgi:crotonobetainyl-CoA:carnitine CoA-transferase CaiB-like acyl-CoA transferase
VLAEWTPPVSKTERGSVNKKRYPLEGVKVLDFGSYLAGPYGPMLLADLGADVVKVEATTGDGMRPGDWAFAGCQRGKRNVSLDLKSPAARPALESLIKWADIVHHNIRMPAARRLGLDPDAVRAINPKVVFCHTSSYGPAGLRADWPGYDQLFQAQCGWEVVGAGEGNPPMWHRFGFMDHQCAMSSIVSTLLALRRRDASGEGQVTAGSLLGPGVLTTSETFRLADGSLVHYPTLDHDQTGVAVGRRIISTAGGWIAVAADRLEQIEALCAVAGVDDATKVPAALADRPIDALVTELETAGVPVEVVREQNRDAFLDSPANRAARLVAEYPHAEWGTIQQTGGMWYFGDMDLALDRAPTVLGEHTIEVLTEIGWERSAINELIASGAAVQY